MPVTQAGAATLQQLSKGSSLPSKSLSTHDEGSLSWSLAVTWFDADGEEQPGFVLGSTASMRVVARVRGSVVTSEHRANVGIARDLAVQGLLPAETEIEIDGAANDTAHCEFVAGDGSAERRYDLLSAGALTDIRQLKDASQNPYPLSGTLTWQVDADAFERDSSGEREAHYEADVRITFNGTRYPVIEVEESWRYRLDLETGEIQALPS